MIETSSLAAALPPAAVESVARSSTLRSRTNADPPLDPPVTLALSSEARQAAPPPEAGDRARYRRDDDSRQIVFQIVGPDGTVVEQLPSEAVMRARAYAREAEAAQAAEIGTSVARSA